MKYLTTLFLASLVFIVSSTFVKADIVSSTEAVQMQNTVYQKSQIIDMMSSEQVRQKLVALGVDQQQAMERINNMTPAEIDSLNTQLNDAPAGAGIVGTIVTVMVVVAVLDVMGITDVYPFIRPL